VSASGGMFLRISCSWVMNSVAVMPMMRNTATKNVELKLVSPLLLRVAEISAPKTRACCSEPTSSGFCSKK
jgi:hypothetical protein